jgi:hypothetical protein
VQAAIATPWSGVCTRAIYADFVLQKSATVTATNITAFLTVAPDGSVELTVDDV